jgi:radical SAM superfamily enzyme YgiQ (UPF0313 family)
MTPVRNRHTVMKILLVGIYDTNSVSLAPQILESYVSQFAISSHFDIVTKEFSIFRDSVLSIIDGINKERPDVVGFSAYIWNINIILEIIPHLNATVLIGGPQVTGIEQELLDESPAIDIIITGEAEMVFKELLECFHGDKELETIQGITTRSIKNSPSPDPVDLNTIPLMYENIFKKNAALTWISFETSRGCPMGCRYCTWGQSKKMRYFPLERVLEELDVILQQKKIEWIYLCDSSILLNKKRAKTILQHIADSGAGKAVRFEFKPEQLDDEVIDIMARLPDMEFNLGIQSVNPDALRCMGRTFNRAKTEENFHKIAARFGDSSLTIDLIYGLPGDNYEGYKASMEYAISLGRTKRILTNPLIILPGSEFYREMDKYGIRLRDKKSYMVSETATFSQEDMELARKLSFYVSVITLNYGLRDALWSLAERLNKSHTDTIWDFMESLPLSLTNGDYPDMIPSVKEDFKKRNAVFKRVIECYDDIVLHFRELSDHVYDDRELKNYREAFSEQYFKMKRFIGSDTA